jgi:DNA-binding CsgD family transcriptional regulator
VLEGRETELRRLDARLAAVRDGGGFALMVHGDPGIGKSALLDAAVERAAGLRVLRARGLEAEAELPFGVLRTLVEPLLDLRPRLAPGQARALGMALALEPPGPQDRFAVGVALLALLGEASPVLAVVDDLQWADPASRDALVFAARRPGSGAIGLLLAARSAHVAVGVEPLAVGPLAPAAARALLAARDPQLATPVADALVELSVGNPLALLELPGALTADQRSGARRLGDLPRPGPRFEQAFAPRFAQADPVERRAAATAAAMEAGTVDWLRAALDAQGIDGAAIDAAERAGTLVVRDGIVSFAHPLVRAAAYHAASADERAHAHRALAGCAPDPRRRAWHLAAAAGDGADAVAAAALEEAAHHARTVGGHAEAASAFARAAALSDDRAGRGRRALAAAEDYAVEGDLERAVALLEVARADADTARQPAVTRLRGNLAMRRGDPGGALALLTEEADRAAASGDHASAAQLYLEASVAPMMTGDLDAQARVIEAARPSAGRLGGAVDVLTQLVAGELAVAYGRDAAGDAALAAVEPRLGEVDLLGAGEIVGMAAQTSMWIGSYARAERIVAAMLAAYKDAGAAGRIPYPLSVRAQLAFRRGDWASAAADAADAVRLARDTGQRTILAFTLAVAARLEAWTGGLVAAGAMLDEALALADADGASGIAVHAWAARAEAELQAGRADAAVAAARRAGELERAGGIAQPGSAMWRGVLVEALVETGRLDEAAEVIAAVADRESAYAQAVAGRGRVLLAPPDGVDAETGAARAAVDALGMPLERARTELAIGARLRAAGRRAEAAPHLVAAAATFDQLGAAAAAARTRALIDTAATRVPAPLALSSDEHEISRLVALGRTNREIAAQLYLSEKTVERRLSVLYRRLGIGSRIELVRLLTER